MKQYKYNASMLSGAIIAASILAACDDSQNEAPYSIYDGSTPSVYFPVQSPTTVLIGDSDSEYYFNISRANSSGSESVQLTWTGDVSIFNLPSSVSFAEGADITEASISFDPSDFEASRTYTIIGTISGTESTPYTQNSITISFEYLPMSEWAPFGYDESLGRTGEGYYVFSNYYSGVEDPVRVMESHNLLNPNEMNLEFQWLIDNENPDLGWETFLTATSNDGGQTIRVPEQIFAYNSNYGNVYVSDMYYYSGSASYNDSYFDDVTGTFYLDIIAYVSEGYFGYGYETCVLNGYADTNDYTITLSDQGTLYLNDVNYQIINFAWTDAVDEVRYVAVETSSISDDNSISNELVESVVSQIANDSISYSIAEEQGNIAFDFTASGNYSVIAVAMHEENDGTLAAKSSAVISFQYSYPDPNEGWTSLGMIDYTDGYLCALYKTGIVTYQVELQENNDTPGYYRLVDPYGAPYPYNEPGDWDAKTVSYLYLYAGNPDRVYIIESEQTLNWGSGVLACSSLAYNYLAQGVSADDIAAAGYFGTLKDGVITFPFRTLITYLGSNGYYSNYSWDETGEDYLYDIDGEPIAPFCIDMNSASNINSTTNIKSRVTSGDKTMIQKFENSNLKKQVKAVDFKSKNLNQRRTPWRNTVKNLF